MWQLHVDFDKRLIAEMIVGLAPMYALEIGCAAGAVLDCLADAGVDAEGVEISRMAIDAAAARTRARIHQGDLLTLSFPRAYDVVFGLDIFEHLNPNRVRSYVQRLFETTADDGLLLCNIPAFGSDPVFGTVFPRDLAEWPAAEGTRYSVLHTDELGYPLHGHLIWADAAWWSSQFEAGGFVREADIERALHAVYDPYMRQRSPARRAYLVFGKSLTPERRRTVCDRIAATGSALLAGR